MAEEPPWSERRRRIDQERRQEGHPREGHDPIGPRGLLELETATCTLAASSRGGLPGARLTAFTGVLTFGNAGEPTFTANVKFEETKNDENAWVHGKLDIASASWSLDGEARLVVTMAGWEMADGVLRTGTAEAEFAGAGKLEGDGSLGRASLNAKQARTRHFIDGLTALAGAALPLAIPPELGDPILDGDVTTGSAPVTTPPRPMGVPLTLRANSSAGPIDLR